MVAYGFKKQFIEPIMIGLGAPLSVEAFAAGMDEFGNVIRPRGKRQTIRAIGRRRHARPGETIQLYTGMRTKQCRKLGEARCKSIEPIRIFLEIEFIDLPESNCSMGLGLGLDEFAMEDGFRDWDDMRKFWREEHAVSEFSGVLITWEPIHG
jgi:hypothetical protein